MRFNTIRFFLILVLALCVIAGVAWSDDDDDDDDDCGRFWMGPVLLGPEGQLPSEAYWGVVQSVWTSDQHQNLDSWIFTLPVPKALKKKDGKVTLVGFGTFSK